MPVSPFRETPARNLMYKIPTEQFVFVHSTYTADIAVEEQQNYPEIVPSVWSVELTIAEKDGKAVVTATVRPKEGVKNTSTMLVECTVRIGVPCKIAPYTRKDCGTPSLESLTTAVYGSCGKNHYRLKQNTHVFVNLFFYPEKLTGESSKDRLDLQRLRESPTLSDCKLVCANEEFPVHRAILAAQSPVFAAMFKNEMLEQSSGVCQIDGISADVLDEQFDGVMAHRG
ncbi:uncharacterized protein LOC129597178 isoform X2 [Paramacrobiotus metropolitanus]|uniref:uncharacterized protein LOC129597178 isoform X2 n=1 Tax=Paramacrobiotus metropolitanus TaxID=2943436 RepID=UPI002445A2A5|nr:uncharacterized protein LOC129597178 isoform X2 [Paramacrobiotus metropolitanus]